jgi:glutathione S-transferase
MADIILHHYWESPYAEKIRRILGFKQIAWQSVTIPMVMPKPDLLALTGGYRKTPVMQIGADIYCDTDCIARAIERLHPSPTLFPKGTEALSYMIGPWQNEIFLLAVQTVGLSGNIFPDGFIEDRSGMVEGGMDLEKMLADTPARADQLRTKLTQLDRQLGCGRAFVLGDAPSLADFSLFHPVYVLKVIPTTTPILEPYANIRSWMDRIEAFGHGSLTEIPSEEAVEIARAARSTTGTGTDPGDPNGRKAGDRVAVVHKDFGRDPVVGELVASSVDEIAIRRTDDRAGDVVVHFPREHYTVLPAA